MNEKKIALIFFGAYVAVLLFWLIVWVMDDFPILKMKDTLKEIERRLSEKIEADNPRFADEIQEDELKVKQLKRSIAILESNNY